MEEVTQMMKKKSAKSTDVELVCKCLQVEHKTFYFDLKENPRGRYLKISEKSSGSRSTIIVPVAGIVWFVDLFSYYADGDDREPSSKELQLDNKVFHFEVRENAKGRFLKVSEVSLPSIRSTIIVPAGNEADEGWGAFRNVLAEIHETSQLIVTLPDGSVSSQLSGTPELLGNLSDVVDTAAYMSSRNGKLVSQARPLRDGATNLLPSINHDAGGLITARVLRAKNKKFYFDLGSNARGQYLRISEVIGADRSAIILPTSVLEQFHDVIGQFVGMVKTQVLTETDESNLNWACGF